MLNNNKTQYTFFIKTLGCKTNQIESELIHQTLTEYGFLPTREPKRADIFILNSCTVTSSADEEALKILKKQKTENPESICLLTGCFAQNIGKSLLENDFIDIVLGNSEKMDTLNYLLEFLNNSSVSRHVACVKDICDEKEFIFRKIINPTKTRASLKIQDGCNNACSYCAIRLARGKSRSNPLENIIEQVNQYASHGFHEVVITGINIGQWGPDLTPAKSFTDLIDALDNSKIERFRLGSLNPTEINDKLLDRLACSEKFCPHFHLSLQSACNKTLRAMNRNYTAEMFLEQIKKINEKFPLAFIGSDIIAGFPGETDEDFQITYKNLESSFLTTAHVFPYSIRSGTPAAEMSAQIPQKIKLERAKTLKKLMKEKYNDFILKNFQDTKAFYRVQIEKHKCPKTGFYKGMTENYLKVLIDPNTKILAGKNLCNTIQSCKLEKYSDGLIYAKII